MQKTAVQKRFAAFGPRQGDAQATRLPRTLGRPMLTY